MSEKIKVHLYASVCVKLKQTVEVESDDPTIVAAALDKLTTEQSAHLSNIFDNFDTSGHDEIESVSFADEVTYAMVDYEGDDEYKRTQSYALKDGCFVKETANAKKKRKSVFNDRYRQFGGGLLRRKDNKFLRCNGDQLIEEIKMLCDEIGQDKNKFEGWRRLAKQRGPRGKSKSKTLRRHVQ